MEYRSQRESLFGGERAERQVNLTEFYSRTLMNLNEPYIAYSLDLHEQEQQKQPSLFV